MKTTITISELKTISQLLLDRVKNMKGEQITFDEEYYVAIAKDHRHAYGEENPQVTIGSLLDDIEGLKKTLQEDPYMPTPLDLKRIGQIFLALDEQMTKESIPWCF